MNHCAFIVDFKHGCGVPPMKDSIYCAFHDREYRRVTANLALMLSEKRCLHCGCENGGHRFGCSAQARLRLP